MDPSTLRPGDVLTNDDLCNRFRLGNSGGMRKSNTYQALVLITNRVESLYEDQWQGNVLHYTGMGQVGDQNLHWSSNRTLAESTHTGVAVHLFEVFVTQRYTYQGLVELAAEPYQSQQLDRNNLLRWVWVFPIRLQQGSPLHLPAEQAAVLLQARVRRKSRHLTDVQVKQLEHKIPTTAMPPRRVERVVYARDPDVVVYALRRAKGICELCSQPAPFVDRYGVPFLEVHHITYLARGGADTIDNVCALCPNCHRRVHALEYAQEVSHLRKRASRLLQID
jgi:5-methylcytosine-specific restriction protein A